MEFLEKNRIEWINKINTFMCLFLKSQTVLEERMKTIENVIFFYFACFNFTQTLSYKTKQCPLGFFIFSCYYL